MAKKPKYLSNYEEDLIWMSYRYCIGRHTIAANMHAGEIAKHAYGKLSPERQQFMAYDIRRSIEDVLRISRLNFFIDSQISLRDNKDYRPLELLLDILKEHNVSTPEDLKRLDSIHVSYNDSGIDVDFRLLPDDKQDNSTSLMPTLFDLYAWADLAACFDTRSHKIAVVKDDDKEVEIEVFESYIPQSYSSYTFQKVWKPVDKYIENPAIGWYIPEEQIIKFK